MGSEFTRLAPAVQDVHNGRSLVLHGKADVVRGRSLAARMLCALGHARDQHDAPMRVEIEARGDREIWTRHFGASPVMRSVFTAHRGALRERFGPAALAFALGVQQGAVIWRPVRVTVFGVPLPRRWLAGIEARAFEAEGGYAFDVKIVLPGVGPVIGYRGRTQSPRSQSRSAP